MWITNEILLERKFFSLFSLLSPPKPSITDCSYSRTSCCFIIHSRESTLPFLMMDLWWLRLELQAFQGREETFPNIDLETELLLKLLQVNLLPNQILLCAFSSDSKFSTKSEILSRNFHTKRLAVKLSTSELKAAKKTFVFKLCRKRSTKIYFSVSLSTVHEREHHERAKKW